MRIKFKENTTDIKTIGLILKYVYNIVNEIGEDEGVEIRVPSMNIYFHAIDKNGDEFLNDDLLIEVNQKGYNPSKRKDECKPLYLQFEDGTQEEIAVIRATSNRESKKYSIGRW